VRPEVADIIDDDSGTRLFARIPETAAGVVRAILGPALTAAGDGDYLLSRDAGYRHANGLVIEAAVAPSRLSIAVDRLQRLAPEVVVVRPLVPVVRAAWESGRPALDDVRESVTELRRELEGGFGAVTVERVPAAWAGSIDPWGLPRSGLEIMRRLKESYDPDGKLNRGRFAGGI
jgi:hypothetical protein